MPMTQNKLRVYVHFVWSTYDRLPLITEEIERELFRCISTICQNKGCKVLALGGIADHVHLLVTLPTTVCIAELIKEVKGGSSRMVSKTLKTDGFFGWQGSYGAFSVSPSHRKMVIALIQNQKRHHEKKTFWDSVEPCSPTWDDNVLHD